LFFLSYAEEDWEDARQVTAMLREHGIYTWNWHDHRGGRFIEEIENAIKQADGFIALMSPYFLASQWCRDEWEMAFQREHDLRAVNPGQVFFYVLEVADTPPHEAGFLRGRDWLDMKSQGMKGETLAILVARLIPPGEPRGGGGADHSTAPALGQGVSLFRNRQDELDSVRRGLANMAGPHFWLVIAPPQLGKTWFLDQLNAEIAGSQAPRWQTQLVDLRMLPAEQCRDPGSLIARLFAPLIGGGRALPLTIARQICRSRKSYLCLLDGGELLPEETVDQLRSELGIIYQYVQEARITDVRLALVVAARGEQGWRGVAPDPRLSVLPLTEFKINVVLHALNDLAIGTGRTLSLPELRRVAERVHDLSEGLPALLVPCLEWIQSQEWLETEALETGALFSEIAHPYIEKRLLARDSLHPEAADARQPGSAGESLRALTEALRLLAPYRMFTQAHLRHHAEFDPPLAAAMATLDWSVERLWGAISGCALLLRPLDEPWQELCPAIRRLLYRYFYSSVQERSRVHHEARKFVEVWARELKGKEQVIGLVECLWHEACEVRLTRGAEMTERLCDSAGKLSRALKPSEAYTVAELRVFAADRIRNDREFRQVLNDNVGLFSRLASIVRYPAGQ
jgi:hypothetical protein